MILDVLCKQVEDGRVVMAPDRPGKRHNSRRPAPASVGAEHAEAAEAEAACSRVYRRCECSLNTSCYQVSSLATVNQGKGRSGNAVKTLVIVTIESTTASTKPCYTPGTRSQGGPYVLQPAGGLNVGQSTMQQSRSATRVDSPWLAAIHDLAFGRNAPVLGLYWNCSG